MTQLPEAEWEEIQRRVPIVCVDVLAWSRRADGGPPTFLLIRRRSEDGSPKWALVGGRVNLDETLEDAIARHLRLTLGDEVTWTPPNVAHPGIVGQYLRHRRDGFGFDPRKHAVALTYAIEIKGPVRPEGEALDSERFPVDSPPARHEIGFQQAEVLYRILADLRTRLS